MKNYQKSPSKDMEDLKDKVLEQVNIEKKPPMVALHLFFSITLGTFTKIDQIQGHSSDQNISKVLNSSKNVL